MDDPRTIVALGGGGFQMTPADRRLDDHLLDAGENLHRPRAAEVDEDPRKRRAA